MPRESYVCPDCQGQVKCTSRQTAEDVRRIHEPACPAKARRS
jgi:hypothetical protein